MSIQWLGWKIDPLAREVSHDGGLVRLSEKPFRVLAALVEAKGDIVTRDTLRALLWSQDTFVDFDNNLNSAVATLRNALGDSARSPRYIETIPKIGYRLIARPAERRPRVVSPVAGALLGLAAALVAVFVIEGQPHRPSSAMTDNREARLRFQEGVYLRGQHASRPSSGLLEEALDAFREAYELDNGFAAAAAAQAETLVDLSFAGRADPRVALARARDAAQAALAIDPDNEVALRSLGMTSLLLDWDFESARAHLERATDRAAPDARTWLARATFEAACGNHDAAVVDAERAVALDPASHYVRADLAFFYLAAGRDAEAAASAGRVLEVAPRFVPALTHAVVANERLGRLRLAVRAARTLMVVSEATEAELTRMEGGDARDAIDFWRHWDLARTETSAKARAGEHAFRLALRHAALGEKETTLAYLERAIRHRSTLVVFLPSFRELDALRSDPHFERLERRVRYGG